MAPHFTYGRRLAFAAATALVLAAALFWMWPSESFATRIGGYERVVLDDGSVIQLNTESKVSVRFTRNNRAVHLLQGEAYFDIARDPSRPFDVVAGETVVRAVGTAFAVRLRESQRVEVLVTQGRVMLSETRSDTAEGASRAVAAQAGETAEAKPSGLRVKHVTKEELDRKLAWQTGQLHFQKEPLAVVIAEFNRYNRRRIELADPTLAALEVHGNFKATDLDSFIAAMRNALKVRVEEENGTLRLFAE